MEPTRQPLDQRAQTIADFHALLEWLAENPDVPIDQWGDPLAYSVGNEDYSYDDEAGLARLAEIATVAGCTITGSGGGEPAPDATHYYVRKRIGHAEWSASYISRDHMKQYAEEQAHLAERRKAVES